MLPILKQFIGAVVGPLQLAVLLAIAAALFRRRNREKLGLWLTVAAIVLAYCSTSPIVGDALIAPLERAYQPISDVAPIPRPGYVVVLGAGYAPHDSVPITAALNQEGIVRLVEAIRLMRVFGIEKLIVSGGAPPGLGRSALGYARLALDLGVPKSSLIILEEAQDTAAEASSIEHLLGVAPFILVTSAAHMPRAMRLMRRAGARPIPAPTGQLAMCSVSVWEKMIPNSGGLRKVEAATHEYLGLIALTTGLE